MRTDDREYAARLAELQGAWWKRALDVQAPYRRHLRAMRLGTTLDLGCGVGRNLVALANRGVGVDPNAAAVEIARTRGHRAFTPDELRRSAYAAPGTFDALLAAHVLEHMRAADAVALLREYLPLVRAGGRVVLITPQERGFRSDPTHVEFMDLSRVAAVAREVGLELLSQYSFPLPRAFGRIFTYNEFVTIARRPLPPPASGP